MIYFAVIDTETNWDNRVMSIGAVIAEAGSFRPVETKYYVLDPEYQVGGMYSGVLFCDNSQKPILCTRRRAMEDLRRWLASFGVKSIFAYNASFDRNHLPELNRMQWFDIIRIAAYRQYNPAIPGGGGMLLHRAAEA